MDIPNKRYESRDVEAKWAIIFALILIIGGVVVHFSLKMILSVYHKEFRAEQASRRESAVPDSIAGTRPHFPEPRLQIDPRADLEVIRTREAEDLSNYGWINRTAGVARIPIDRAMELVVQRGLSTPTNGKSILELQQERAIRRNQ